MTSQQRLSVKDTPRPSASLILVNSANEVLLIQRNKGHSFGGMHVSHSDLHCQVLL